MRSIRLFLYDGKWCLSFAEARKVDQSTVLVADFLPFRLEALGRKFNVQVDNAGLFLFGGDFHNESKSKAGTP